MTVEPNQRDLTKLQRWKKRIWLFFAACCGFSLIVGFCKLGPQSDIAPGFRADRFKQISLGMPVQEVFDTVGYPFTFGVHSLRPGGSWEPPLDWTAPVRYTEIKDVAPFLTNQNNRVIMEYARPYREGGSFRARQVAIYNGKVINTAEYTFWAFLD